MGHRKVIIALDSFKGSISATHAAASLARGIRSIRPDAKIQRAPIADGGEGTVAALITAGFTPVPVTVTGPLGGTTSAAIAVRGSQAVVELASAAGLHLLPGGPTPRAALGATTLGVGELINESVRRGASTVVVGLGGSCTSDGGAGLVRALGAILTDVHGNQLAPGGGALRHLHHLRLPDQRDLVDLQVIAASDVDNPLLGESGAARTYGPQKGAGPDEVDLLELALTRWADVVRDTTGRDLRALPGTGAAGGTGFALASILGAQIRSGIDVILDWIGFDEMLSPDALVIVGEGSLDAQTLNGKGPLGVARRAQAKGCEVVAVVGRNTLATTDYTTAGLTSVHTLLDIEPSASRSITHAASLLQTIGERLGPTI